VITTDMALRFWLRYAEHQGAVYEEDGDGALVVLPEHLQAALELPETIQVTVDPEAARDDGASLLIPGYGPLDRAATCVLEAGDAGWSSLAEPTSEPPSPAALLAQARDHVPVDHGRIDPAGEPTSIRWPVARVGAFVTYAVSLDRRF